jgi:hypothetical protein
MIKPESMNTKLEQKWEKSQSKVAEHFWNTDHQAKWDKAEITHSFAVCPEIV